MKLKCASIATVVLLTVLFMTDISVRESDADIDPESIMGIWRFEGKGNTVEDSSSNDNEGKIVGAKRVAGKEGQGIEFDGSNHVVIPASETVDDFLDGFTYLLWAKPLAAPSGPHVRLIERDWHNPNILIGNGGDFYGSFIFNGGINNSAIRGGTWKMDEWAFVALTHDGKTLIMYANGEKAADLKVGKPEITHNNDGGSIWLARWKGGPGWDFKGVIDEVAAFNVPLSEADINAVMEKGLETVLAVSPTGKLTTTWSAMKTGRTAQ